MRTRNRTVGRLEVSPRATAGAPQEGHLPGTSEGANLSRLREGLPNEVQQEETRPDPHQGVLREVLKVREEVS